MTLSGEDKVKIDFTATGEDLDYGTGNLKSSKQFYVMQDIKHIYSIHVLASLYELRFSKEEAQLLNETTWGQTEIIVNGSILEGSLDPEEAGNPMELFIERNIFEWDIKYYMAIKAYDSSNKTSELSNIASFKNSNLAKEDNGLSGGAITGIILSIIILFVLCIFVIKVLLNRGK